MEKLKCLWTAEFEPEGFEKFAEFLDIEKAGAALHTEPFFPRYTEDEIIEMLKGKDVYMNGGEKVTRRVVENCPDLKLLMCVRDGAEESIDVKACEENGLPVISGGGRCQESVAELNLCLMLLMARPVVKLTNTIHEEGWTKENAGRIRLMYDQTATELFEKTAGIVGLGRNGYQLAQFLKPFHMNIIAYDPYKNAEEMAKEGITMVDLDTLMKTSDYVILLARVTPETVGLVSREKIEMMKPTAVLINTGRAALLDNDALFDALEQNKIKGACLDTHVDEPNGGRDLTLDSRELKIDPDKLLVTPHMAGKTAERPLHQYRLMYATFRKFIDGEPVPWIYARNAKDYPGWAERGAKMEGINKK